MQDVISGKVWKFGHDLDADADIFPFAEMMKDFMQQDEKVLSQYAMTPTDPDFPEKAQPGDILVAGRNFGKGHPHVQGIQAFKGLELGAVICDSVSRGYFRKAIIYGLPMIPCEGVHDLVEDGDELEIRISEGKVTNLTSGESIAMTPLPSFLIEMIGGGGMMPYLKKKLAAEAASEASA